VIHEIGKGLDDTWVKLTGSDDGTSMGPLIREICQQGEEFIKKMGVGRGSSRVKQGCMGGCGRG